MDGFIYQCDFACLLASLTFVANLCIYANHYYELCIYTYYHIIILYSDDGSGNCRNMSVLKLRSVIISVKFVKKFFGYKSLKMFKKV